MLKQKIILLLMLLFASINPIACFADNAIQTINYPDGSQYKGALINQSKEGQGQYSWANGDSYIGNWKNDKPQGKGRKTYADGRVYEGDFIAGVQQGSGTLTFPDGTIYKGEWYQNNPHGLGSFIFKNGDRYTGSVSFGLPQGKGHFDYANGDHYHGQWQQGKRSGQGTLRQRNGDELSGSFVDGMANGSGILRFANGDQYQGNFVTGKPEGEGRCLINNVKSLCSYEAGKRIAYAAIPTIPATKLAVKRSKKPRKKIKRRKQPPRATKLASAQQSQANNRLKPAIKKMPNQAAPPATPITHVANAAAITPSKPINHNAKPSRKAIFADQIERAKQQVFSQADLATNKSDILFSHNFKQLNVAQSARSGWWQLKQSLFNDQLKLYTRVGKLHIDITIDHFEGPGRYALTAANIKANFNGATLRAMNTGRSDAGTLVIKQHDKQWLAGELDIKFAKTAATSPAYKIDQGVFRLDKEQLKISNPKPHKSLLESFF